MSKSITQILSLLCVFYTSLNLSGQTPYELTLDNNTGITSFLATDFNVNNKDIIKVKLLLKDQFKGDLFVVGDLNLSDIKGYNPELHIANISNDFGVFNNDLLEIFKLSNIVNEELNLELIVDAGPWRNPITFLNEKTFNNLSYKSSISNYRHPFFVHLTNSFVLIMLLFGIMSLIMFGISKIKVYLYYGMHALMISVYYVNKVTYLSDALYNLIGMGGIQIFNNAVQPIMYYFLALFLYEFLDTLQDLHYCLLL